MFEDAFLSVTISLDLSKLSTVTTLWENQAKNTVVKIKIVKTTLKLFYPHYVCKFQLLLVALLLSGKKVVIRHTSKPGRCFAKMGKLLHLQILLQKKSANSTLEYYSAKWPIKLVLLPKDLWKVSTYVKRALMNRKNF